MADSTDVMTRRRKYDDPPWLKRLTLTGRGSYRHGLRPLHVLVIGGGQPYINLTHGEDEEYMLSLSPTEARRLAAFLNEHISR